MKGIFVRLAEILGIKEPSYAKPFYGLTESDIKHLRDFRASDGFEVFTRCLDTHVNIYAEQILAPSSRDAAALHEVRGVILGLRKSALLVDEILQAHARKHDAERAERELAAADADARRAALYGSPSWGK